MKIILVTALVCLLCGCGYFKTAERNNELMLTLKTGQTKEEVLKIMGEPSKNEKYAIGGKDTDIWFYRTDWDIYAMDADNFTPMVFEDGKLACWGKDCYEQKIEFHSEIK